MSTYTSNSKRFCSVYKSSKKQEMYLYVDRKYNLSELPEGLFQVFGQATHVLDLVLTPEKKLARVSAEKVLAAIADQGFYLQMPPSENTDIAGTPLVPRDSLHG